MAKIAEISLAISDLMRSGRHHGPQMEELQQKRFELQSRKERLRDEWHETLRGQAVLEDRIVDAHLQMETGTIRDSLDLLPKVAAWQAALDAGRERRAAKLAALARSRTAARPVP